MHIYIYIYIFERQEGGSPHQIRPQMMVPILV